MFFSLFMRVIGTVFLWAFLWPGAADETPGPQHGGEPDFDRLAEIFALPGGSELLGEPWVVVDQGPANWQNELEGWLIEDGQEEIAVLDWYGETHTLRKPRPNEERPKVNDDSTCFLSEIQNADYSVAWNVRREDYHAKSRKFLEAGPPKKNDDQEGVFRMVNEQFGLQSHIIDAARHAHFAHHLGRKEHAKELYAYALGVYKNYADQHLGGFEESEALPVFVANKIAFGKRNGAIYSGYHGTSRKELKEQWEKIAAIPHHQYREEAKVMARHYRNLLEEDARWVEPSPKEFEEFTTEQKAAYWLYHLRDLDIGQMTDPGSCHILLDYNRGARDGEKKQSNAAKELKNLGMAAVPALIAHLEDARPTRCKGHWRSYWPEGHYLLRYGDCCQQIFESITGERLFQGGRYPIQEGVGSECKEKAEKWWREYQKTQKTMPRAETP